MTKREQKAAQFNLLMNQVEANYKLDKKVYVETLEGSELATVIEINPSKFTVSCSVVLDLGNGRQQTLMFTASDIEVNAESEKETPQPVDVYQGLGLDQVEPVKHDNLHLLTDNYKLSAGYVKVEAECEKTKAWYNVYIPYSDIEFSLDIEEGQLETYCLDDNATDGICTAANDIYERYLTGTTTYDIVFEKQKVKGYKFLSQLNKEFTVCASKFYDIIEVERFREQNNYKSYTTVLG